MNNEEYNLIQGKLRKYQPEIDTDLTEWIHLIRHATIEIILEGQPFRDNQSVIQIKQMDSNDLSMNADILLSDDNQRNTYT
jgi:hypothetical protein